MNPESAADYVANTNLKGLIEWLTAETMLSRPDDPVQFCRDILGQKLVERGLAPFQPLETSNWLRASYAKATAEVDENGIIHGENIEPATASLAENLATLEVKLAHMESVMNAVTKIPHLDTKHVVQAALRELTHILNCDRSAIYLIDNLTNELLMHSSYSHDDAVTRFPRNDYDLNASAISSGETINLMDASSDTRFDRTSDIETGYQTFTVLVMPLKCPTGEILGTVHAINKRDNVFKQEDEDLMSFIVLTIALALRSSEAYRVNELTRHQQRDMLDITTDILRHFHDQAAINTCICERVKCIVEADRCVLYCVDNNRTSLFEIHNTSNTPLSLDRGLVASVISSGSTLNIKDAYDNPLFSAVQDKQSGYLTKAVLVVPLKIPLKRGTMVIGALYFSNKVSTSDYEVFTSQDVSTAELFCETLAPLILRSDVYKNLNSNAGKDANNSDEESDGETK